MVLSIYCVPVCEADLLSDAVHTRRTLMMVQAPARRSSTPELLLYSVVVAYTVFELTRGTYIASREFDPGHRHSGMARIHQMDLLPMKMKLTEHYSQCTCHFRDPEAVHTPSNHAFSFTSFLEAVLARCIWHSPMNNHRFCRCDYVQE